MPSSHNGKVILSTPDVRVVRFRDTSDTVTYHVEYLLGLFAVQQYTTRSMAVVAIMIQRDLVKQGIPLADWLRQLE